MRPRDKTPDWPVGDTDKDSTPIYEQVKKAVKRKKKTDGQTG